MQDSVKQKRNSNIGCWRFLKRNLRSKISWNDWALKHQLRFQLFAIVMFFFTAYYTFLIILTWIKYKRDFISIVSPEISLKYQSRIVSTS